MDRNGWKLRYFSQNIRDLINAKKAKIILIREP